MDTIYSQLCKNSQILLEMHVPGDPVAMARPKLNRRTGTVHNTPEMAAAKSALSWQIAMAWSRPKLPRETAVFMYMTFYFKARRKKDIGRPHLNKPDGDNLAKLVMDAANGIVYKDDCQVADHFSSKRYAETSSTSIRIWVIE